MLPSFTSNQDKYYFFEIDVVETIADGYPSVEKASHPIETIRMIDNDQNCFIFTTKSDFQIYQNKSELFPNINVTKYVNNDEKEIIKMFLSVVEKTQAKVFYGYNCIEYKWKYLVNRIFNIGCVDILTFNQISLNLYTKNTTTSFIKIFDDKYVVDLFRYSIIKFNNLESLSLPNVYEHVCEKILFLAHDPKTLKNSDKELESLFMTKFIYDKVLDLSLYQAPVDNVVDIQKESKNEFDY